MFAILILQALILQGGNKIEILSNPSGSVIRVLRPSLSHLHVIFDHIFEL